MLRFHHFHFSHQFTDLIIEASLANPWLVLKNRGFLFLSSVPIQLQYLHQVSVLAEVFAEVLLFPETLPIYSILPSSPVYKFS